MRVKRGHQGRRVFVRPLRNRRRAALLPEHGTSNDT
jgi:hypothetical protein